MPNHLHGKSCWEEAVLYYNFDLAFVCILGKLQCVVQRAAEVLLL